MRGSARSVLGAAALASSFVLVAVLALHRIDVADFFWQYRTGELVSTNGVPYRDTLTFASAGAEWIELRWLFCLLQFGVCTVGGFGAATLAATLLVVASFALCVEAAKGWAAPVSTAFVVGVAAVASSERFVVRPELVSFLFLALSLVLICRWREVGGRGLWLLPVIQIVWTNSHTLFALGPALLVQLWIVEAIRARRSGDPKGRLRQASIVLVLVFAACLANPYGLSGALFPLRLLAQTQGTLYKETISELKGPIEFSGAFTVLAFYFLAALTLASAAFARRRADAFLGLVCATHAFLAFSSVRNLPLFALAAVPFIVGNLRGRGAVAFVARLRPMAAVSVTALCFAGVGLSASNTLSLLRSDKRVFGIGLAPNAYPLKSMEFLRARGWSGPVFNTLVEGGALEAYGWLAYFDPRLEVHSESVFREGLDAAHDPEAFRRIVERYGCRVALAALDSPLYNNIASTMEWKLVAFDAAAAVFADPRLAATWPTLDVESSAESIWEDAQQWPEASRVVTLEELAGFFIAVDAYGTAAKWANRAIELAPSRPIAYAVRGRVEQVAGETFRAAASYQAAVDRGSDSASVWNELAVCLLQNGDRTGAGAQALRALKRFPENAGTWAFAGSIAQALGEDRLARSRFEAAAALEPKNGALQRLLGLAQARTSRLDLARRSLERACVLQPKNADFAIDLALVLIKAGDREGALQRLEVAKAIQKDHPRIGEVEEALAAKKSAF